MSFNPKETFRLEFWIGLIAFILGFLGNLFAATLQGLILDSMSTNSVIISIVVLTLLFLLLNALLIANRNKNSISDIHKIIKAVKLFVIGLIDFFRQLTDLIKTNPIQSVLKLITYIVPLVIGFQLQNVIDYVFKTETINVQGAFQAFLQTNWIVVFLSLLFLITLIWVRYNQYIFEKKTKLSFALYWITDDLNRLFEGHIRCTLWVPVNQQSGSRPLRMMQVCRFVPPSRKYKDDFPGKTFAFTKHTSEGLRLVIGIVGYAAMRFEFGEFRIIKEYINENVSLVEHMTKYWNLDEERAKKIPIDRRSFLALPITDSAQQGLYGVLYFDSSSPKTFTNKFVDKIEQYLPRIAYLLTAE